MMLKLFLTSARLALLPAIAAAVSGCATTPTTVRQSERADSCRCDLKSDSLGQLLEHALTDRESPGSAHALAHFVERWHRLRREVSDDLVEVNTPDGPGRRYRVKFGSPHNRNPLGYFDEISPASDYKVKKLHHHRSDGVGAPLVAVRENRGREL
jgi:hypothetical protein